MMTVQERVEMRKMEILKVEAEILETKTRIRRTRRSMPGYPVNNLAAKLGGLTVRKRNLERDFKTEQLVDPARWM